MIVQFDPDSPADRNRVRKILAAFQSDEPKPKPTKARERAVAQAKAEWFEAFWAVVHVKLKRAKAEPAFFKAVDRVAKDGDMAPNMAAAFIIRQMEAYAASPAGNPTDRSPTHPATWLNAGQYEDDPKAWQLENGTPKPQPRKLNL